MKKRFPKPFSRYLLFSISLLPLVVLGIESTQDSDVPSEFTSANVSDPVSQLMAKMRSGTITLKYESDQGYLKSLLKELDISPTSQILVFSKTSLQSHYISPSTPRAVYFNDRAYVGWVPGAPNIEIAAVDPNVGPTFYILDNRPSVAPVPLRQTIECFQCHYSPLTGQVPGLMARSVYTGPEGGPRLANGSFRTTPASPMKERWGGWYVTGQHGGQRHMGNVTVTGTGASITIDPEKGANIGDLSGFFDTKNYLSPHSDIVALLIAEQQMTIQNLITKAGFLTRRALKGSADLVKFGFTEEHVAKGIHDQVQNACEPLVEALLGTDEPALTAPVSGTSGFERFYANAAPADKAGRRLSELDLKTRLLKYPCSPMIYSVSFENLPEQAKSQVMFRIREVLTGKDQTKPFSHITSVDRKAILEILSDTLKAWALQRNPGINPSSISRQKW
ncbi:MAG: hypothetical protein ABL949_06590 [Fimbriimonadaceae bacterium]